VDKIFGPLVYRTWHKNGIFNEYLSKRECFSCPSVEVRRNWRMRLLIFSRVYCEQISLYWRDCIKRGYLPHQRQWIFRVATGSLSAFSWLFYNAITLLHTETFLRRCFAERVVNPSRYMDVFLILLVIFSSCDPPLRSRWSILGCRLIAVIIPGWCGVKLFRMFFSPPKIWNEEKSAWVIKTGVQNYVGKM
jgi:hypothetical protein